MTSTCDANYPGQALGAQVNLLRSLLDSMEASLAILSREGTILYANRRWAENAFLRGASPCLAGPGGDFFAFMDSIAPSVGEVAALIAEDVGMVLNGGHRSVCAEYVMDHLPDAPAVEVRAHLVEGHRESHVCLALTDITAQMRTQEELQRVLDESSRLALVARYTANGVVITRPDGVVEWVNESFTRMTGFEPEQVIGRRRLDLIPDNFSDGPEFATLVKAIEAGQSADVEFLTRRHDGDPYWTAIQVSPIVNNGDVTRVIGVELDVTERRTAQEQALREVSRAEALATELTQEKRLLSTVLATIPHTVWWKDPQLRFVGCNDAFLELRGLASEADLAGRLDGDLGGGAFADVVGPAERAVLETGQPVHHLKATVPGPDGSPREVLFSVLPNRRHGHELEGVIGVGADVTHISELERQLGQATRLESIGQLAAGIAHEINTPVQFVSDNVRFLTESFGEIQGMLDELSALVTAARDEPAKLSGGSVQAVLQAADLDFLREEIPNALSQSIEGLQRVAEIVRAMKDFSHPGQNRTETDLNRAIDSTVQVSRSEWKYVAEVALDLDPELGLVPCYEGELKQVVLNILVNAAHAIDGQRHAIDGAPRGNITVTTRRTGDAAIIAIRDDGPGMPAEVRARVFDPFFTTKEVGKGTGQGLSLAHSVIVKKHGGTIEVASAPGEGTTFTIALPLRPAPAPEASG